MAHTQKSYCSACNRKPNQSTVSTCKHKEKVGESWKGSTVQYKAGGERQRVAAQAQEGRDPSIDQLWELITLAVFSQRYQAPEK